MSVPKAGALAKASDWTTVFPVDTDAWSDWTPVITQGVTVTKTITRAKYFKVGRCVQIMADLSCTSSGTAANAIVITGLPFAAAYSSFQIIGAGRVYDQSASDDITGLLRFPGTSSSFSLLSTRANGNLGQVSFTAALVNTDIISFSGAYEASS